jgi:uncharacterized protein YjbJ (UPF0337 family)
VDRAIPGEAGSVNRAGDPLRIRIRRDPGAARATSAAMAHVCRGGARRPEQQAGAARFFLATQEDTDMANEDQTEGKAKGIGGKIKEEVGDATGNDEMKHDGQGDQAEGKLQKGVGDAKDSLSDDK